MYADRLNEFTKFPELPPEVRLINWDYCILPRIVGIRYDHQSKDCYSESAIPNILHVNAEARHFALQHYTIAFGIDGAAPKIYFDFEIDTFYLGMGNLSLSGAQRCVAGISNDEKRSIRHIAMDDDLDFDEGFLACEGTFGDEWPNLQGFRGSNSVTIVRRYGGTDLIVAEVDDRPGKYQAWSLDSKGQASKFVAFQPGFDWKVIRAWRELEDSTKFSPDGPKCLIRGVPLDRLIHRPEWEARSTQLRQSFCVTDHKGMYPRTVGKGIYFFLYQLWRRFKFSATYHDLFYELRKTVSRTWPTWDWNRWNPTLLLLAKYGVGYEKPRPGYDGPECGCHYHHPEDCCPENPENVRTLEVEYDSIGITNWMERMADHLVALKTTVEGQRRLADIMAFPVSGGQA